jgi:hypothetical protein
MSAMFSRLREERGSALVAAGVMAAAFILLGSAVVEIGQWLSHRRHVQVRTDAAALSGGQFLAECFNIGLNGFTEAQADTNIENAAKDYGGITSTKNTTPGLDQGAGEQSLMSFQGNKYPDQQGVTRDLQNECFKSDGSANLMLDVKMAETGIPKFFGFSPLETVHGWARVQLQQIQSLVPTLPFAIPDVRVRAAVTFVNNATGLALAGCPNGCVFQLTGPTKSGGLSVWSTNAAGATIPMPAANTNVGMRVGLGNTVGSCASNITPTTYTCYDDNSVAGLVALRSYDPTAVGTQVLPVLQAVTPTTCSGSPFFSDYQATAGACSYGVTATVDWGNLGPPAGAAVRATVNGTNLTLVRSGTTNTWVSTNAVTLNTLQGRKPVTMSYCLVNCGANNAAFIPFVTGNPAVQQIFSGSDSPIFAAQVLDNSTGSASYSFPQNQNATLAVSVGLSTGVSLPVRCSNGTSGGSYQCATDPPVLLRNPIANGGNDSLTLAISCGHSTLRDDITFGCTQPYSINVNDICPDPANPNPPDCALTRNGGSVGQLTQGMNDRFAPNGVCDANNYPNYQPGALDPRAVTLIITDWNAFDGSGKTTVPVVTFATFYVTGWSGAPNSCTSGANPKNEPSPPLPQQGGNAFVWGHYIADVNLGAVPNGSACVGPGQQLGVTPCAIALTR